VASVSKTSDSTRVWWLGGILPELNKSKGGSILPIFFANKKFGTISLIIATVASFGRIHIGIRYPLDVLGGAAFGVLAAIISWYIVKILNPAITIAMSFLHKIYLS
jgi:membrane-associated phospholipid phosphatase